MRVADDRTVELAPSASRLTESLRDIGYDLESAVADLVDNSVTAGARNVSVRLEFDERDSWICIADDGHGMTKSELIEGLRFGTRRSYNDGELGRFGLGLKTASISQCRRVNVFSRRSTQRCRISGFALDLDHIASTDRWELAHAPQDRLSEMAWALLARGPGTVVFWTHLDRVIDLDKPESGWNRRRLEVNADKIRSHLGMVFHRFLENDVPGRAPLTISVNGVRAEPWNPMAPSEATTKLPTLHVSAGKGLDVTVGRYVLPARHEFSDQSEFERLSGPRKWNRQQGFYVYRAHRMIQSGGWCGLRAIDEHTKLARVSLDFPTSVDTEFKIDVSKMRVSLPAQIKSLLTTPIAELVATADQRYRHRSHDERPEVTKKPQAPAVGELGALLLVAALEEGLSAELDRIMKRLGVNDPDIASGLGW